MKHYHINMFYSAEDKGYIADIPDLKYCSAFGKSPSLALAEVERAKKPGSPSPRTPANPSPRPATAPRFIK